MKNGSCPSSINAALVIPFDTDRTKETVKIDAARPFVRHNQQLLTRRVSRKASRNRASCA